MAGEPKEILENMPSLGAAFRLLRKAFEWQEESDRRVWGEENLFQIDEFRDPDLLFGLHRALADPNLLRHALANSRQIDHGLVSIGTETAYPGLESSSVVGFPFAWEHWQGWIGVLGPMRMDYALVFHLTSRVAEEIRSYLHHTAGEAE
jgi:transcriptional regulator of heat shock response